ncbi:MAG: hypothetical protein JXQ30_03415 [Spirochaetes bacterium]|nr:hypothetical protein [Spirochaetota bacterium]
MEIVTIVGWSIVAVSLLLITLLVLLSNNIIKRIEKRGYPSLREIVKERKSPGHKKD